MLLATGLLTVTRKHARSPRAHDATGCLVRPDPARGWRPAKTAWKARVALAWVVSLSAHSVVLAALGWSLPGRPSTRWIAVTPGQASIALLASPAAEFVAARPDPPLPEPRRPAEEPPTATPVELAPQAETVVRRETPHAPPSDWAELALAERPPERPPAELPMVPSRRDLTDQTPPVPNETDSSPPRADDAERQAELPPSTADARPSLASLDSQGAQDQAPAAVHNPAPEYPAAALQARQTGRVVLLVGIQPDGSVAWAKLAQPSGVSSLDQAALQVIRRWRFSPTDEATAVRTIRVPFRFVLDE